MSSTINFTEKELKELYLFMEEFNELFHQPMNYQNSAKVEAFAKKNYPNIRKFYYEILWGKLPQGEKDKILDE